ncbi:hypothetical protein ABW20_dc0105443 [Dactylellina cionopaga]|nr:hypothetical protein ABW20_dc0105443 [Dactylellina cionopaga]
MIMMFSKRSSSPIRRAPLLVLACILITLLAQAYYLVVHMQPTRHYGPDGNASTREQSGRFPKGKPESNVTKTSASQQSSDLLRPAPLHDIVLTIKTGATVIHARVPVQLLTFVPNFANTQIFSDIKTKLGSFHVADALDRVTKDEAGSTTLNYWKKLQSLHAQNIAVSDAEGKMGDLKDGWALDRFKNVPILIDTYQKYPNASYYLFIDGDTSLISSNWFPYLVDLTQKHDPRSSPIYLGSVAYLNNAPFGHGGSGYLINQAAVRKLIPEDKMYDESFLHEVERKYTKVAAASCCGDAVFSVAMADSGIAVQHKWPYYQGETWWSIPYHESNFCREMGTLHHVLAEDMQEIFEFEQAMLRKTGMDKWRPAGWTKEHETGAVEWNFSDMPAKAKSMDVSKYKYILFRDMYDYFIAPKLPKDGSNARVVGWDNLSWKDTELNKEKVKKEGTEQWKKDAITSEENCRVACEKHKSDCIQWYFRDGICGLGTKLNYGRRLRQDGSDEDLKRLGVSGWVPSRVEKKVNEWRSKCPGQVV